MAVTLYPRVYPVTDLVEMTQLEEPTWTYNDTTSGLMVKPSCYPCKLSKAYHQEVLLVDDSEYLTILVGH